MMNFSNLFLLSCALAMDAFAVSLCKGFRVERLLFRHYLIVGIYFGVFAALMPFLGYFLGVAFEPFVKIIDHWIAFVLLMIIGVKMLKEGLSKQACKTQGAFGFKTMFSLALATNIDSFTLGISFAFLRVDLFLALFMIASTTFIFSVFALKIGNKFGILLKNKAEILGGVVLIFLGFKILIEHLFLT